MPTALVTGAGVRIGSSIARQLASAGFQLLLHAHGSRTALEALTAELVAAGTKVQQITGDLSTRAGVREVADQVLRLAPSLDLLVNNAALFERVRFEDVTEAQYRRMLGLNLDAPFFLTQSLLPALRAPATACVINLADIGGERPVAEHAHYSVAKAGVIMLTKALALELAPKIRVNAISPGAVAFPSNYTDAERTLSLARIPLGREGSVDDVARAVRFLALDAPYVTGQVLAVDGGRSAQL